MNMPKNVKTSSRPINKGKKHNRNKKEKVSDDVIIDSLQERYSSIDVSSIKSFKDLPLSEKTLQGLEENNYLNPSDIQRETLVLSLQGIDILGAAKTGSGKTLAFLIPILEKLYCLKWSRYDGLGAVIITPTRELASQIFETLNKIGHHHDFSAGLIIGGKDLQFETNRLHQCNIIICTPGRLLQHMDENPLLDCNSMKILVLDEADRCLDLGFEKTMNNIIENFPPERQTLLFSATQTRSVKDLARLSLKDPRFISVHADALHATPEGLEQSYIICELHDKMAMLWSFIKNHVRQKVLVFMSSCKLVRYYYQIFCSLRPNTSLLCLYGTLHQLRRMSVYEEFCRKSNVVLFATDIASRGLDFPAVDWVLQLDCPEDVNTYIHRAGRTARYFKGGESLLVLLPNEEPAMIKQLEEKKIPIKKIEINSNKLINPVIRVEATLAKNPEMKMIAQRAFVSYAKSVFLMKNKSVFDVHKLDTNAFARSLGLSEPPRIRFLQRLNKQNLDKEKALLDKSDGLVESENDDENDSIVSNKNTNDEIKSSFNRAKDLQFKLANDPGDDDSDDEFIEARQVSQNVIDEYDDGHKLLLEGIIEARNPKKPVTKADIANALIKKKIAINKKIIFDEEEEVALDGEKDQVSQLAKDEEEDEELDIELAKQVLSEFDKQHFQKKVWVKNLKGKPKPKQMDMESDEFTDDEDEDDDDDEPDLSWLPDPDKVYPADMQEEESEEEEEEEEMDSEASEEKPSSSKRKINLKKEKATKRPKFEPVDEEEDEEIDTEEDEEIDTGLLMEDEELALNLLRNTR